MIVANRTILVVLLALLLLLLSSCSNEDLSTSSPPHHTGLGMLYVVPGGLGTGAADAPMGSIQAAIDSVMRNGDLGGVRIAAGVYDEFLHISGPITLRGGLDPASNWEAHATDSTVITGGLYEDQGVGVVVDTVDGAVDLSDLVIRAPSGTGPGAGSYAVCCWESDNVRLTRCRLRSSAGTSGADGAEGARGMAGDDGQNPDPGMNFARGGRGASADLIDPERGFCPDNSQTGGMPEEDGGTGGVGADGSGAAAVLEWRASGSARWVTLPSGSTGTPGTPGCGGGGGRSALRLTPSGVEIIPGGGGGGAGQGGAGGNGGHGGGCSVGIVLFQSSCTLTEVDILTASGGAGGNGGGGGGGGDGGDGGPGRREGFTRSRSGGDGGDGGRGGRGGGGAGGWSIGVLLSDGASVGGEDPSVILGSPGSGGGPDGSGAVGQAAAVVSASQ